MYSIEYNKYYPRSRNPRRRSLAEVIPRQLGVKITIDLELFKVLEPPIHKTRVFYWHL
jgi:hypothetical protein